MISSATVDFTIIMIGFVIPMLFLTRLAVIPRMCPLPFRVRFRLRVGEKSPQRFPVR
ncbi:MAG: hypothetical protein VKK42_07540 [Lyngbya sp.]|nr:hypothetical protein [Lyngbya sp.]